MCSLSSVEFLRSAWRNDAVWAITKQVCRDELVVFLSFSSHKVYIALLLCIEHCFTKAKIYTLYIYIYIYKSSKVLSDERLGAKLRVNFNLCILSSATTALSTLC